jgi:hypothetical protein
VHTVASDSVGISSFLSNSVSFASQLAGTRALDFLRALFVKSQFMPRDVDECRSGFQQGKFP